MAQDDPQESNNQQLMEALILLRLRLERVIQTLAPQLSSMMDRTYRLVINRIEATPVLDSTAQTRLLTLAEASVNSNLENVMRELRGQMQVMADASATGTSAAIEDIMNREVSPDILPSEAIGVEVLGVGLLAAMNRWRQSFLEMIQETMAAASAAGGEGNDGQLAAAQLRSDPGPITGTDSDLQTEIVTLLGASTVVGQTNVVRRDQAAIAYWIRLAVLDSKTSLKTTSYVEMADGSRKMLADINVGELIITKSGKPRPVKNKTSYLTHKLVRLTLSDEQTIECTPDHLLWTPDGWRQAQDFASGDELTSEKVIKVESLDLSEPVEVGDIEIDDPYEHNYLICKGKIFSHNSNICLSNHGNRTYPPDIPEFPPFHPRCRTSVNPVYRDEGPINVPESGDAWLRTQSADSQREVLGPTRYNAWRAGELQITPEDMLSGDGSRPATLREMRSRGIRI